MVVLEKCNRVVMMIRLGHVGESGHDNKTNMGKVFYYIIRRRELNG
jgi:hypothetical protein